MKFEMELHPNFVSDIVVKQLQEMYEHTKEAYFYTDPEEARAAIALVLDYFMAPSDYAQWRADNGFDRSLVDECVEGFDHLEKKRSREEFLEDLYAWARADKPAWISLKITERNRIIDEWNSLVECTVRATKEGRITMLCKMIEAKLKELNT